MISVWKSTHGIVATACPLCQKEHTEGWVSECKLVFACPSCGYIYEEVSTSRCRGESIVLPACRPHGFAIRPRS